jgi:endonuclease/exonuclease/phosphatase (EEP) superfamily protein YafD
MRRIELLAKLAALGLIAASLAPLGAHLWWVLDLAAHFRVQYVAAAVLLIAVLGARKRFAWCAALAAAGAISAVPVLPYVAFGADAPAAGPTVRLLSANLYFGNHSGPRFLEVVREASPDVIVLVEFTAEWEQRLGELRQAYPHYVERSDRGAYGIAVYSRYEIAAVTPLPLGRSLALETRILSPRGPFTLIGVHLRSPTSGWRAGSRSYQLGELAERRAAIGGPLAIAGDFNITPYSPLFSEWLTETGLTDSRRGRTLSPSWPTYLPVLGIPIDHCVVSDEIRVVSHRRLPGFGSDHYPILVELAIAPEVKTP